MCQKGRPTKRNPAKTAREAQMRHHETPNSKRPSTERSVQAKEPQPRQHEKHKQGQEADPRSSKIARSTPISVEKASKRTRDCEQHQFIIADGDISESSSASRKEA
mmetsp:Transcript_4815/g.19659  ORF Transcript_4815/g.19659 Transcript_4815/m.19659 type:complete len:106 (+) Transcript_4815:721-1038(+)